MKSRIAMRSAGEGYNQSRLPEFTGEQVAYIKGTHDFFALNTYSSEMDIAMTEPPFVQPPSRWADMGIQSYYDPSWINTISTFLKVRYRSIIFEILLLLSVEVVKVKKDIFSYGHINFFS